MTYDEVRADFEYLETHGQLHDWISIDDEMRNFMEAPTKKTGRELYKQAITLWFSEHLSDACVSLGREEKEKDPLDEHAIEIAIKYGEEYVG